jgi:phospholipid/cholesterol/gamma-HCH transport system substrate-binding protein
VVLATQDAQAVAIKRYLNDLVGVTGVIAVKDRAAGRILRDGTTAAGELRALGIGLEPVLPQLLGSSVNLFGILAERRDGIEEALVAIPWALASAQTPGRDGRAHFTFVAGVSPTPCRKGYIPAQDWKSPFDPTVSHLPDSLGCREPASVPRGVTVK